MALLAICFGNQDLQAQAVTPMTEGRLVDATGQLITEVFSLDGTNEATAVVRINNGRLILLRVGRFEFLPQTGTGTSQTVYFTSADCTGQAWVLNVQTSFGTTYRLQGPNQTLYLADPTMRQVIVPASQRGKDLVCLPAPATPVQMLAADPMTDLLVEFTPPFIVFAPR